MPKDVLINSPPNHCGRGFQLQKYHHIQLTNLIGRGTFSKVFLSNDIETGETIAVKVMDLNRFEEEFNSEVSIMMALTHKGIDVGYRSSEIDEDNDIGYIYMNFVPFPTLAEYIERVPVGIQESQAISIFQNLVKVIEELHGCNIAHNDLKPENIFIDPRSNDLSVIDFGLSSIVKDNEYETKSCGSPLYMSPERLNNEIYDPLLADIWSMGVILYEMLLGCNPWSAAECLEDLIDQISQINFPCFLSKNAIILLSGMLQFVPGRRDTIMKVKSKINSMLEK